jgi:hypothetical protein
MTQLLTKMKEFSYQFLDLLFILEYENIHDYNDVSKRKVEREPLSDAKPTIN